ncbi:MAG: glycosyltransferase family 4 protein [Nitrospirae bacterium]|nr:glycosyltransferase family 4 protein [Nitrospirota bacterium]
MHILFLTDNFPPEVNAPASRTFEHCREWVRAGHQVTVVTGVPNFPKGTIYPGYRNRLWQSEVMDNIRVIRVWTYITGNEGFVKRTLDYLSYMVASVLAAPWVKDVDLVIGTSPQFFTACAAYVVSRCKGIPFVFELRDLWPESIKAVGAMKHAGTLRLLERMELFLYRKAAAIVSLTNSFKRNLVARHIPEGRIVVVTNGADLERFGARTKDAELVRRFHLEGKFVAGYIGTHGMAHALETILDAADKLRGLEDGHRYRIILLGDGARKQALVERARSLGLGNVIFLDSVPKEEVVRYWSLLDVGITHLKKEELFKTVIPSKLFECMAMGIPVLHGVAGESAEIVEREGVGILFEPENAAELCLKLQLVSRDPAIYEGLRARCVAAARGYDRTQLAGRMLKSLEDLSRATVSDVAAGEGV